MQLCKFISTEPVAEFICGGIYEYKIYGPNQYTVYNSVAHERTVWFSASHFSEYFKVMEPSEPITDEIRKVAKEVEAKRIDGYCKLKPGYVHDTKFAIDQIYPFYVSGPYTHTLNTNQGGAEISCIHFHQRFDICDIDGNLILDTIDRPYKPKAVDMVNNPPHYKGSNGIESIDVIENFGLGFNTGNAVKYILRAGRKDITKHKEDLQKAIWYLNRELSYLD